MLFLEDPFLILSCTHSSFPPHTPHASSTVFSLIWSSVKHFLRRNQIMKLFIMQSYLFPSYLDPFRPKNLSQHPFSNTTSLCSSLNLRDQVSRPNKTTGNIVVTERLYVLTYFLAYLITCLLTYLLYLPSYLLTYLLTYLFTYLLHGAESFLRS